MREFFAQGDEERRRKFSISPLCDRKDVNSIPGSQKGFINFLVQPVYTIWTEYLTNHVDSDAGAIKIFAINMKVSDFLRLRLRLLLRLRLRLRLIVTNHFYLHLPLFSRIRKISPFGNPGEKSLLSMQCKLPRSKLITTRSAKWLDNSMTNFPQAR